jgi:hypothetical protein
MWGFQLWVNLPARDKMTAPRYQDIQSNDIPDVDLGGGVHARVITGELGGVAGPVTDVATAPVYFDLHFDPGATYVVPVPAAHNVFVYVYQGSAAIGPSGNETRVARGELAMLSHGGTVRIAADETAARMILVGGQPLGEPIARYGPFVMNTTEEIYKAFEDYRAGRM